MFSKNFWVDALERAVKTAAQFALVVTGAETVNGFGIDYVDVAGFAAGGFVISVLTSVASSQFGSSDSASVVD